MTLTPSWLTFAAGPRLRSFMFRTIVLQNRGVCSCWNFQGAFQNGGGFLRCSEGAECTAVIRTVIHAVSMMDTVDGCGSGGDFIHENQLNCGSIVPTCDLHPSPPGAVLQQAREPKLATGGTAAIPGTRSQKIGMQPREGRSPKMGVRFESGAIRRSGRGIRRGIGRSTVRIHEQAPAALVQAFTCVHLRSPAFTCVHLRSPAFTCVHLRSPAFTCVHLRLPAFTCVYLRLPAFACVCLRLPAFACVCLRLPAFACVCLRLPAFACVHERLRAFTKDFI